MKKAILFTAVVLLAGTVFNGTAIAGGPGSLTIVVETSPRDRDVRFHYDTSESLGASPTPDFTLTDDDRRDARRKFEGLSDGRYRVIQDTPSGWNLDDVNCDGDKDTDIDIDGERLTITLDGAENIICTFFNTKDEPAPTPTVVPVSTPVPPAPTREPTVPCVIGSEVVVLVGLRCPQPAPTATATPVVQVAQIRPPATGDAGLLP